MNEKTSRAIGDYIDSCDTRARDRLRKMRVTIAGAAPAATEALAYGIPTFKLNGKNLVHFAAFKNHIGFFPTSSGIRAFKKELTDFKTSRGTVQFPFDRPIPYGLVTRITRFRLRELKER